MKNNLIYTEDYILLVSDDKAMHNSSKRDIYCDNGIIHKSGYGHKIIAHKPLNGAKYLDGVPVLPEIEDEVEKLAEESTAEVKETNTDFIFKEVYEEFFKEGYNKAKETYKYTEEDMRKAWNNAYIDALAIDEESYKPLFFEDFIQSLNQPKLPVAFISEHKPTEYYGHASLSEMKAEGLRNSTIPKTITNAQGRVELVGTYIFEL